MFSPAAFWTPHEKTKAPPISTDTPPDPTHPAPKRQCLVQPTQPSMGSTTDRLGTYIHAAAMRFAQSTSWSGFIAGERGPTDVQLDIPDRITHPATQLLAHLAKNGVPVLQSTGPWSQDQRDAAMLRGSHQSTKQHQAFLREEMADMIDQQYWIVIPYSQVSHLPNLRISPMGVVPQRDRRPRVIVDYSFANINADTIPLAPMESMQFGRTLDRVLHRIHHANRRFGPVHLIKVDIADGFYRLLVASSHIPALGVVFPHLPGEEPLVAFPLVLPMGWVSSPPYFCALTETAADIANSHLCNPTWMPAKHPLSDMADAAIAFQPVSRRPLGKVPTVLQAVPLPHAVSQPPALAPPALPTTSCFELVSDMGGRIPHTPLQLDALLDAPAFPQTLPHLLDAPALQQPLPHLLDAPALQQPLPHLLDAPALQQTLPHLLDAPAFRQKQPHQLYCSSKPLAYVDLYMDDFLGLAQGHPQLRERVRSTLLHSIDQIFRPLAPDEASGFRKDPISHSKLNKGDASWSTRKCLLGWIIDTVTETIELPEHRATRLLTIITTLRDKRRISLKKWQQAIGELRSMVLALPGGKGLFSMLYTGLSQPSAQQNNRVRLNLPIQDALTDLLHLANNLAARPTRIGEIVATLPVAYGTADACGLGMGGIWMSADPMFTPLLWRTPFLSNIQRQLITQDNRAGSITNSDLELAAQIAELDILIQSHDCREVTISTFTDNICARAWQRKGSKTTLGPAAYLLRLQSLHQRYYRYHSTIDYLPGPLNSMADDASRLWHLSDTDLLLHFNSVYPQPKPWRLLTLRPAMNSVLTTSLQCKRSEPELFLHAPDPVTLPGFCGPVTVPTSPLTPCSPMWPIPSPSSKSLPPVTAMEPLHPVVKLSALVPWKQPSGRLARRWPAWGPRTSA